MWIIVVISNSMIITMIFVCKRCGLVSVFASCFASIPVKSLNIKSRTSKFVVESNLVADDKCTGHFNSKSSLDRSEINLNDVTSNFQFKISKCNSLNRCDT